MRRQRAGVAVGGAGMLPIVNLLHEVAGEVLAVHPGVSKVELLGRRRHLTIARARKDLYRRLRLRGLSYLEIAWLTNRDHSTVMSAVKETNRNG